MKLTILSPEKMLFSGEVDSVSLPGSKAPFTVLANHAPIISSLQPGGVIGFVRQGKRETFVVEGGFVEVHNNVITVCTDV